jgi:selenide,water dikinase
MVNFSPSVERIMQDILFDPQTSGGLLICVDKESAENLLDELQKSGIKEAAVIGEVVSEPEGKIVVD